MEIDPTPDPITDLERAAEEQRSALEQVSEKEAEGAAVDPAHRTEVEQAFHETQKRYEEALAGRAEELARVWHSLWIDVLKVRLGNKPSHERGEWLATLSEATGVPEWALHNVVRQEAAEGDPAERGDPPTMALLERADALAEKQRQRFARRRAVVRQLETPPE
jgi:hypothetical protein